MTQKKQQQSNESAALYEPDATGQKRFVHKHFDKDNRPKMAPGFEDGKDRAGNTDAVYRGTIDKTYDRSPRHGYAAAPSTEDEKVYEGKTWRREGKKHAGGAVKKFLQKKKQKDERRLQESFDIPEGESLVLLVEDINEAAGAVDVRALKGTVAHRQFVGIVGTSPDQEHYIIQDGAGRRHHIFTNKELGDKGDKVDVHVQEYKKGGGLLSVAKKNVVKEETELDEVSTKAFTHSVDNDPDHPRNTAHREWQQHLHDAHVTLSKISGILREHKAAVTKRGDSPYPGGKGIPRTATWNHAETMKHYGRKLQDLHDEMAGKSSYVTPSLYGIQREEVEIVEETDLLEFGDIADVRQRMMAANKVHQIGTKFKDKEMQNAAKSKLQQLAKAHANLMKQNADEQFEPVFAEVLEQVEEIVASIEPEVTEDREEQEFLELAQTVYEQLDDEGKKVFDDLVDQEDWDSLIGLITGEE